MPAPPRPSSLAPPPRALKPSAAVIIAGLPAILTVSEVAALLRMAPSSLARVPWDRALRPYRTPAGHRRYQLGDVAAFIDRQTQERSR